MSIFVAAVQDLFECRAGSAGFGSHMSRRARSTNSLAPWALASLLCVSLAGCSGDPGDRGGPPLVLGFSQVVGTANWDRANAESVRNAAREAGVELRLEDARRSQETQIATLRSFVKQRVDVIAFSPVVQNGWDAVLREVRSAGIPVVLLDRTIEVSDDSLYVSLIGSDFVEEGRQAAHWLLEHTQGPQGEIGIVELRGTVGSAPANDRKQGFAEIIAADPRYRILRSRSADFDRDRARELMAEFLQAEGRRIRVLFTHSDTMAFGAIEAIEDAGLKPGSDILVISIEGSRKGLEAIIAGKLNVTVECSPLLGPPLMTVVRDLAAGKPVPRRVVTQETVFTRENAAAELPQRAW